MGNEEVLAIVIGMLVVFVLPFVLGWFVTRKIGRWPGSLAVGLAFAGLGAWFEPFFGVISGGIAFFMAMFSHAGLAMASTYARFESRRRD